MRMHGHGAHDDMRYVPPEMLEERWRRATRSSATRSGWSPSSGFAYDEVEAIRPRSPPTWTRVRERALASPMPDRAIAGEGVFAEAWEPSAMPSAMVALGGKRGKRQRRRAAFGARSPVGEAETQLTYLEAISDAPSRGDAPRRLGLLPRRGHRRLRRRLQGHGRVPRGVRRATAWSTRRWPRARSSASRSGAAIEGLRPVCEMQFADFIACGFDQLVNVVAKLHYRQGIAVPMVVRLPSRRRLLRRALPLAEPRGVVPPGAGPEGRRAREPPPTPRGC